MLNFAVRCCNFYYLKLIKKNEKKVLDTKCFERLLGKCVKLIKAGIRTYKFVDAEIVVDIES